MCPAFPDSDYYGDSVAMSDIQRRLFFDKISTLAGLRIAVSGVPA